MHSSEVVEAKKTEQLWLDVIQFDFHKVDFNGNTYFFRKVFWTYGFTQNRVFILYWLNGEELQDCICDNYDEATNRFDYLNVNWQFIFPYGFTALELVDQYFDPINQFNPITDSPDWSNMKDLLWLAKHCISSFKVSHSVHGLCPGQPIFEFNPFEILSGLV